ncbi:undecaprenyl-diphosphate phosphatase [Plasticicumulans acidivorans]|uniref:Undecaprenyl-diphosphatase n=1 Tax=Plasticicumulans acidivorans TaxID=886464 RepID=A0A317MZR3_9GAMM|nr:undecaprenyl-diphosphate phosphatase [Plasticicumulans acidivorans]PWV65735.1 undecaprenyl-diphosphatase [Plasticicumulans acidivorans]
METLELLKALILGLVEGATEFLPVSSTGHQIIVADFLNFTGERAKTFEIFIQLGAIIAVIWYYRERIAHVLRTLGSERASQRMITNLLIAFMPAAVIGLAFNKAIKAHLFNPITVSIALIVGGFIIMLIEARKTQPTVNNTDDITPRTALLIGVAQCFALVPGTSRSGSTIMGSLLCGLSRPAAAEFSFFLSIPTMIAATLYSLYKARDVLSVADVPMFSVGFIAAFFSGFFVVKLFLAYISKHSFVAFAWYRIVLGVAVLAYFWFSGDSLTAVMAD